MVIIMIEYKNSFKPVIRDRGEAIYQEGKVGPIRKKGNMYKAIVHGSEEYRTFVKIEYNTFVGGGCSCPFNGNCKHMVALLEALEYERVIDEDKEDLDSYIKNLSKDELNSIILDEMDLSTDFYLRVLKRRERNGFTIKERIDNALANKDKWEIENNLEMEAMEVIASILEEIEEEEESTRIADTKYLIEALDAAAVYSNDDYLPDSFFDAASSLMYYYEKDHNLDVVRYLISIDNSLNDETKFYLDCDIFDRYIVEEDVYKLIVDSIMNGSLAVMDDLILTLGYSMDKKDAKALENKNKHNLEILRGK